MKSNITRVLLALVAASVVTLAPMQANASSCSLAGTAGNWAYTRAALAISSTRVSSFFQSKSLPVSRRPTSGFCWAKALVASESAIENATSFIAMILPGAQSSSPERFWSVATCGRTSIAC